MHKYRVNFRDFLHNNIDFSTIVYAYNMNDAVHIARVAITMPKYVIADFIVRIDFG